MLFNLQGIPEAAEISVPVAHHPASQTTETGGATAGSVSGGPNSSPLNMFPQVNLLFSLGHQKDSTRLLLLLFSRYILNSNYGRRQCLVLELDLDLWISLETIPR